MANRKIILFMAMLLIFINRITIQINKKQALDILRSAEYI